MYVGRRQADDDLYEVPVSYKRPLRDKSSLGSDTSSTVASTADEGVLGGLMNYVASSLYGDNRQCFNMFGDNIDDTRVNRRPPPRTILDEAHSPTSTECFDKPVDQFDPPAIHRRNDDDSEYTLTEANIDDLIMVNSHLPTFAPRTSIGLPEIYFQPRRPAPKSRAMVQYQQRTHQADDDYLSMTSSASRSSPQPSLQLAKTSQPPIDSGDDLMMTQIPCREESRASASSLLSFGSSLDVVCAPADGRSKQKLFFPNSPPARSERQTFNPGKAASDESGSKEKLALKASPKRHISPGPSPVGQFFGAGRATSDESRSKASMSPKASPTRQILGAGNAASDEEWKWPAWAVDTQQPCIEVWVEDEETGETRWCKAVPLQKIVDTNGKDKFLAVQYLWDEDAYEQDFEPHHVRHSQSHKKARV